MSPPASSTWSCFAEAAPCCEPRWAPASPAEHPQLPFSGYKYTGPILRGPESPHLDLATACSVVCLGALGGRMSLGAVESASVGILYRGSGARPRLFPEDTPANGADTFLRLRPNALRKVATGLPCPTALLAGARLLEKPVQDPGRVSPQTRRARTPPPSPSQQETRPPNLSPSPASRSPIFAPSPGTGVRCQDFRAWGIVVLPAWGGGGGRHLRPQPSERS